MSQIPFYKKRYTLNPAKRGYRQAAYAAAGAAAAEGVRQAYRYFKKPGKKSRKYIKNQSRVPRQMKSIKKQVRELKRVAESDMGTLVYRDREEQFLSSSVNQQNAVQVVGMARFEIEEALAQLRYYDPAAPSALVTASGATGSYQKEFYFKRSYAKLLARNNYQVPCRLSMYVCQPKADTSITTTTAWTNGLTDASNGTINSVNIYPSDSPQFGDLWRIVKSKKVTLNPGQQCTMSHSVKPFQYDPSLSDSHGLDYQTNFNTFVFLVVAEGVIGHDTVANERGCLQSAVDMELDRVFEIRYAAGADIKFTYVSSSKDTFTNGGVVSNMPISDNQGYSVA